MHRALRVAAQDHQLLAHARDEEVARLGDQALVPDEQPGAGEQLVQFLAVEVGRDEDLAADHAALDVDHLVDGQGRGHPPNLLSFGDCAPVDARRVKSAQDSRGGGSQLDR